MSDAIYNYSAIAPAIRAMQTRRVDIAGMDDSNHLLSGHGNDHGWQFALANLVGIYATGIVAQNDAYSNGSGIGYLSARQGTAAAPILHPSAAGTGTVSYTHNGQTVTGSGTAFLSEATVGQVIRIGTNVFAWVVSIESDTLLTVAVPFFGSASGQAIIFYPVAPAELHRHLDHGSAAFGHLTPHIYSYVEAGQTIAAGTNGLLLQAGNLLDVSAAIVGHLYYGTFDSGAGEIPLRIRLAVSPYTVLATATVATNTGTLGDIARADLAITAGSREGAQLDVQATGNIVGPAFFTFWRASNPAITSGVSYHVLSFRGGTSLRSQAISLQAAADATVDHLLTAMVDLQTGDPILIVRIASGLNDRGETLASVGPAAVADGDSAEAFADNCQAIINRLSARWTALGYAASGLYFLIEPSHPISDPDDAELLSYVTAAQGVADDNDRTAVLDLRQLTDFDEMAARGWYLSTSDRSHRSQAGYEQIAVKIVRALLNDVPDAADVRDGVAYDLTAEGTLVSPTAAEIVTAIAASSAINTQQQANVRAASPWHIG